MNPIWKFFWRRAMLKKYSEEVREVVRVVGDAGRVPWEDWPKHLYPKPIKHAVDLDLVHDGGFSDYMACAFTLTDRGQELFRTIGT